MPAPRNVSEETGPLKAFRNDDVSASIFARTRKVKGEDVTFYSVSLSRSYVDANGVRKYVKSFDADRLGRLEAVIYTASEFIQEHRFADIAAEHAVA